MRSLEGIDEINSTVTEGAIGPRVVQLDARHPHRSRGGGRAQLLAADPFGNLPDGILEPQVYRAEHHGSTT